VLESFSLYGIQRWPPRWMATGAGTAGRWGLWALLTALLVTWRAARLSLCALLVLIEPLVAAALVPLAYLGFLVTIFFGFVVGDPRFPKWGMLGLSVGALCCAFTGSISGSWLPSWGVAVVGADEIDLALLELIAELRRFEPRTLEIAKRHFIHGETAKRLSVEYGLNVQRVYAIRREVIEAAWTQATIVGPKELVKHFEALFKEALARHTEGKLG
jgi:hypothetical protein